MVRRPAPRAQAPTRTPPYSGADPPGVTHIGAESRSPRPHNISGHHRPAPVRAVTDAPAGLRGLTPRATLGWDMACN